MTYATAQRDRRCAAQHGVVPLVSARTLTVQGLKTSKSIVVLATDGNVAYPRRSLDRSSRATPPVHKRDHLTPRIEEHGNGIP